MLIILAWCRGNVNPPAPSAPTPSASNRPYQSERRTKSARGAALILNIVQKKAVGDCRGAGVFPPALY
jgi:hypothetical protein